MISIGLCMIMKNESKVLLRCLNSVYPILDHYTVIDTGSTDDSKSIVTEFFKQKGIPGHIYDHPWIDYANARNQAIFRSKRKTDFNFTIDCDNVLKLHKGFKLNDLKLKLNQSDLGMIRIDTGNINYLQRAFWRNSKPFQYNFPTHEILECEELFRITNLENISVTLHPDGKSWENTREKFLNNAKILLSYIDKHGLVSRAVFYLAESYKDAGESLKAIEWYQKRLEIRNDGWHEELYWSQLMIAGLKWELSYSVSEVADEYMKCQELDELRAEHLYFLKIMYEKNNRIENAKKIAQILYGYKNPYPSRSLFINPDAYRH